MQNTHPITEDPKLESVCSFEERKKEKQQKSLDESSNHENNSEK
jgi:hypothetical protein